MTAAGTKTLVVVSAKLVGVAKTKAPAMGTLLVVTIPMAGGKKTKLRMPKNKARDKLILLPMAKTKAGMASTKQRRMKTEAQAVKSKLFVIKTKAATIH
jgi:hypothetical protein